MTPQEIFGPKELKAIMDRFQAVAACEAILSMKDTGPHPDTNVEDAKIELDGYVSRYNAALIQAGENPTDAAGLAFAIVASTPHQMVP